MKKKEQITETKEVRRRYKQIDKMEIELAWDWYSGKKRKKNKKEINENNDNIVKNKRKKIKRNKNIMQK